MYKRQAVTNISDEDYGKAVKKLNAMDAIYPFGPYAQKGQLNIIYAYYMNDDSVSADVAADRYIHLYPQGKYLDYAYYMKGVIGFNQGITFLQKFLKADPSKRESAGLKQSFIAFKQLVTVYPNSRYRHDSILRMRYIRNVMAKHQLSVAQFYLAKHAYIGAINRANIIISQFPLTPSVKSALKVNIKAYTALHMPAKVKLYQSIYNLNFH